MRNDHPKVHYQRLLFSASHLVDQLMVEVWHFQLSQAADGLILVPRGQVLSQQQVHLTHQEPHRPLATPHPPDVVQPGYSMLHTQEELGPLHSRPEKEEGGMMLL